VDAKFAGFVAGSGDYTTLIGTAAYDYGLPAQFWAIEQFDRNEERVHVHVENRGVEREITFVDGVVLGA
jgi:hypothetical protein